jgi:FlaA1/EpsC-like NDP-sugar epimerase
MLGRGENSIYEIENELGGECGQVTLETVIADTIDWDKVDRVFADYRPDVVFHAAAHKHVTLMERHPDEAVKNNVFGTLNVGRAARDQGASVFVLISTDKAVNPENVMGATKKVAEMIVQDLARAGKTKFLVVRFGNVIRSRGSVIPLFEKQIRNGGPVTITHPEVTRYFMSISEAAHLVLQSGAVADRGSICVLDMGEPVRILDLARNLIRMAGLRPDEDVRIEFTGLRPGDKLVEELLTSRKNMKATRFEKIFLDEPDQVGGKKLHDGLKKLEACVKRFDRSGTISLLQEIVPTYRVQHSDSVSEKRG